MSLFVQRGDRRSVCLVQLDRKYYTLSLQTRKLRWLSCESPTDTNRARCHTSNGIEAIDEVRYSVFTISMMDNKRYSVTAAIHVRLLLQTTLNTERIVRSP